MAPVKNGRLIFKEYPGAGTVHFHLNRAVLTMRIRVGAGFIEPGKTIVYDDSETIDLDSVPLEGGVLVKMLAFSIDPYLRRRMVAKDERKHEVMVGVHQPVIFFQ